jgi:hypothetical protein
MSMRPASQGRPTAKSMRLALRTANIVATSSDGLVHCVFR